MEGIIKAGGVAAAAIVLAYGFYRGLLAANIIPRLNQKQGFVVVLGLIGVTFVIALAALQQPGPQHAAPPQPEGQSAGGNGGGNNSGTNLSNVTVDGGSSINITNNTGAAAPPD